MKAIIAEKPSVAREIAHVLNISHRKDGYITGNGFCITWAFGHLIELGMPEDHGIEGFVSSNLRLLPRPFKLVPRKIKDTKGSRADPLVLKQLKIIEKVIEQCDSIIVATDAGREGELIFRYIYEYLNCKKPFERLWISSLTEKSISEGFRNLRPGSELNQLYEVAKARSEADWLVGINASQALTIASGGETYSLGRVQTPSLALICKRYIENQQFKEQRYYQLQLGHRKDYIDFESVSAGQWENRKDIEKIRSSIEREGKGAVENVQIRNVSESAPLLYDLTALQKEANRKLGLTADAVLQIAQSLYEKQFITYPRTGSQYIPEGLWSEVPELVRVLTDDPQFKHAVAHLRFGNFNKGIVNDLKVTDHHGLLTTHKIPSALSSTERSVYQMIAYRFLESLSEPCIKEVNHILIKVHHYDFNIKGTKIVSKGWRSVRGILSDHSIENSSKDLADLPAFRVGEELRISSVQLKDKTTQAPKLLTEADLLSAMENAGRMTTEKDQKNILRNMGIGTPATKASIIETLIKRNYIVRKGRVLQPNDKGLEVYKLTMEKLISDVDMTADWELALHKIEEGLLGGDDFMMHIQTYTREITAELLALQMHREDLPRLQCPQCREHDLIIGGKIVKCPDEQCSWIQFRTVCGVQLKISDLVALINEKRTPLIRNMKAKSGKKFDAFIVLQDDHRTVFEFPDR